MFQYFHNRLFSPQSRFRSLLIVTSLSSCVFLSGCNYFILLGYLIGGPPSIAPDFDEQTGNSMTDKDVTVAVMISAAKEIQYDMDRVDHELSKYFSGRLHEHRIQTVNPQLVHDWMDKNPEWDRPTELGTYYQCTYVIYVDLHEFSLLEKHSHQLYRGRAEGMVSVYKMDEDFEDGEKIYSKELISVFPLMAARSTDEVSYQTFKAEYLSRLSEELGRLFYEYYNGDDIPHAM
ncbi:hypothetical protein Pla110_34510 [Polystyrenella longa]|uniref:Uncharacterized protein n=1 Tax=Polystyrenella longa TaxID=2528007 RepID=A0A518CR45_9PLAN|nr:hypothetical protein [Polystyrenella longa]QDU81706.1 hypothetical protein Pla110_34510 [Polystyrenella longa]